MRERVSSLLTDSPAWPPPTTTVPIRSGIAAAILRPKDPFRGSGRTEGMLLVIALASLVLPALVPASAAADGLQAVGIDARPLSTPGGDLEYTTRRAGGDTP